MNRFSYERFGIPPQEVRLSRVGKEAILNAKTFALKLRHNIGTEHLLSGITALPEPDIARGVLSRLGIDKDELDDRIFLTIQRGDHPVIGAISLTPGSQAVLRFAEDERRRLYAQQGASTVGSEHILLGLLREGEGTAAGVLESMGINLLQLRQELLQQLPATPTARKDARALQRLTASRAAAERNLEQALSQWTKLSDLPPIGIQRLRNLVFLITTGD